MSMTKPAEETAVYDISMKHDEDSLYALAHMQYDLFSTRNFVARSLLSLVLIGVGAYFFAHVWGIALLAYGAYLMTSTYSASNYRVRKLLEEIQSSGSGFPSSRYLFEDKRITIIYHPGKKDEAQLAPVFYTALIRLGEDGRFFYLFPHERGGYCVPKEALGEKKEAFRRFIEEKSGQHFYRRRPSPLQRVREWLKRRASEPEHL